MAIAPHPLPKWTGREQMLYEATTGEPFDVLVKRFQAAARTIQKAVKAGNAAEADVSFPSMSLYGVVFIAMRKTNPAITWDEVLDMPLEEVQSVFSTAGGEKLPPPQGEPTTLA